MKGFRDYLNERITLGVFTNETRKFVPSNYVELREKIRSRHFRLDEIELPKELDSLSGLFEDRDEISKKGLETWDVSNVSKINHLFRDCVSFTGKEIENWNVKNIEGVSNTFEGCKKFDADLSNCGNVKETLSLSERTYHCSECGFTIDRDLNASINILNAGLKMIEATDATTGTSLKNQSLRSSKKTQILSEKNCETRKTIKKRKESL